MVMFLSDVKEAAASWLLNAAKRRIKKQYTDQDEQYNKYVALACYELGLMKQEGNGVSKNEAEAKELFLKAADYGHITSRFKLGCMLLRNNSKDEEGFMWLEKSAKYSKHAEDVLSLYRRHSKTLQSKQDKSSEKDKKELMDKNEAEAPRVCSCEKITSTLKSIFKR